MGVSVVFRIDVQLAPGVWTDITADTVASSGVRLHYGIDGNGPLDRVASTGQLQFVLRNDARCSGGVQGYYSPNHVNKRAGWRFGIPVRVVFTYAGNDYVKFRGKVQVIDPDPGQFGSQRVLVTAYDGMRDLVEGDVVSIDVAVDQSEDALMEAVLDALPMEAQPVARDLDPGVDVYPYAFDQVGRGTKAAALLRDIAMSAQGLVAFKGDGTFIYRSRSSLMNETSAYTFANTMHGLVVPSTLETVFNHVRITVHPRSVDATATTVLYALTGPALAVAPGQTVTISGSYRDPTDPKVPIGGTAHVVPLVAGTDYVGNSAADGSGVDLTSSLSVVVTPFASSVRFEVTNNDPSSTVYLVAPGGASRLQIRGKGVYDLAPQTVESFAAQDYGDRLLLVDLPLQDDANVAQDLADFLRIQRESLDVQIDTLDLIANDSSAFMTQALEREPGDRITITETVTGLAAADAFITRVELDVSAGGFLRCRFGLAPASVTTAFVLDDASLGLLDTSVLGYA